MGGGSSSWRPRVQEEEKMHLRTTGTSILPLPATTSLRKKDVGPEPCPGGHKLISHHSGAKRDMQDPPPES